MASGFNAARIKQAFAAEAIADHGKAARVGKIVSEPGASSYRVSGAAIGGTANTLASNATSASTSDAFTFEASYTLAQKYIKHTIPLNTLRTDTALGNAGVQMAQAIRAAMDADFFSGLEGCFTADHPRAGAGAGQVGAAKKYLSTGLKYLAGEGGEGTQDNLLTSALDEAALNSAVQLMLQYRNDRGAPLHLGSQGGLVLVVAAKNAKTAHELVVSQLSGSDMASNFVRGLISDVVVYPFATDDDDWFLVDKANAPVGLVVGDEPTVEVNVSDDGLFAHIVGKWTAAFWRAPYEPGLIGSNVA